MLRTSESISQLPPTMMTAATTKPNNFAVTARSPGSFSNINSDAKIPVKSNLNLS